MKCPLCGNKIYIEQIGEGFAARCKKCKVGTNIKPTKERVLDGLRYIEGIVKKSGGK